MGYFASRIDALIAAHTALTTVHGIPEHAASVITHGGKLVQITGSTYVGNNTASRAIPHTLTGTPWLVLAWSTYAPEILFLLIPQGSGNMLYMRDLAAGSAFPVTSWNSTNFHVGNATNYENTANSSSYTYQWIAFGR